MSKLTIMTIVAAMLCGSSAFSVELYDHSGASKSWINKFRAQNGQAVIEVSPVLTKVAARHARDMSENSFFSHTGSDGSTIGERAGDAGYRFCIIAENIAKGQRSLSEALEGWRKSTGHRRNILLPKAREFAVVRGPGDVWVMVLGAQAC